MKNLEKPKTEKPVFMLVEEWKNPNTCSHKGKSLEWRSGEEWRKRTCHSTTTINTGNEEWKNEEWKNHHSTHRLPTPNTASTADYRHKKKEWAASISKERIKCRHSSAFISLLAIIERQGNLK